MLSVLVLAVALVAAIKHEQSSVSMAEAPVTDSNFMEVVATRLPLEVADSGKPQAIGEDTAPLRRLRIGL